jgi:hypothetical protein
VGPKSGNQVGLKQEIAHSDLGTEADAALNKLAASVKYGYHINEAQKALEPVRTKLDDVQSIRHMEIRQYLLSLNPAERDAEYRAATLSNDAELLDAVERAPAAIQNKLVHPRTRTEMREARLAARNPECWKSLQMWETIDLSWRDAISAARYALEQAGIQFPSSEPTVR